MEEGMNNAKDKVAGGDIFDDEAKRHKIIYAVNVLVVFGKFFMEGIDGFYAAIALVFDMFFFEGFLDGLAGGLEFFVGFLKAFSGELLELFVATRIEIREGSFLDFDADAPRLHTVGEWGEDFERFAGDLLLFIWRQGTERAEIMETVGELNNKDADVLAGSDEEFEEVVASLREIFVEVLHTGTSFAKFSDTVHEEGDVFAKFILDFFERKTSILDRVVQNASYNSILIHIPFLEDLHNGNWVDDIRLASLTELAFVSLGRNLNCFL